MDEQTATVDQPVSTETPVVQEPTTTPGPVQETPQELTDDWYAGLDKAEADKLRKHPRIAGIVGNELQKERERREAEIAKKERERLQAELEQMAQTDPEGFAAKWLTEQGQKKALTQINQLEANVRNELGKAIGKRLVDEPAWQELSEQEKKEFFDKLNNIPENEVIPVFNDMVTELRAEYRANKKLADFRKKELAKEREALKQELAAEMLKSSTAPDTTSPKGQAKTNVDAMDQKDFDKYWNSLKGI